MPAVRGAAHAWLLSYGEVGLGIEEACCGARGLWASALIPDGCAHQGFGCSLVYPSATHNRHTTCPPHAHAWHA